MASKWQKQVDSDAKSFRRSRTGTEVPGSAILVVTEGRVTEPIYFDEVKRKIAIPTVELVPHGAGAGDPRVLAKKALELQQERLRLARNRRLAFNQAKKFDELWIVFDTDVIQPAKLNDGLQFANSKGILVASSTPCFEFWLLLHLTRTTMSLEKYADVKPILERKLRAAYSKNKKEAQELIPPFVSDIRTAIKNALWIRQYHKKAETPLPANPSTDVDLLISAINNAASPAHRKL
jgi:hypothetical protein